MAEPVEFTDMSATVIEALKGKAETFLTEAAFELESETKRTTPPGETQLKGSWDKQVDYESMTATVGSPLESALWNEFGTGSYAEHGDGRKGWWVYVEGQGKSATVSKTYANEEEANQTVIWMRMQGLPAHASNGKIPRKTLRSAFFAKKDAIIRRAKELFGGEWQ